MRQLDCLTCAHDRGRLCVDRSQASREWLGDRSVWELEADVAADGVPACPRWGPRLPARKQQ